MKLGIPLLLIAILLSVGAVIADKLYVSKLEKKFLELEKQRIVTSNKLATAKIVQENLNHVRDLVLKNMEFPNQKNPAMHESHFFDFITTCINDLKLKLVSVKPLAPVEKGRITVYGYDIEIEGDFFKFGELCSKFENSRRIVTLESFSVDLLAPNEEVRKAEESKKIKIVMRVNTYRVKKAPANPIPVPAVAGQKGA
ncbi:MAG: type 4a pilus biogenesis protein PilO [Chitinivibrionales bacterium]|nr:type 4a pilus biogenesis protein PilO [Chitinivibrionales bacterium]